MKDIARARGIRRNLSPAIEHHLTCLIALLSADVSEMMQEPYAWTKNEENWQADVARKACIRLLEASRVETCGGCLLCQG